MARAKSPSRGALGGRNRGNHFLEKANMRSTRQHWKFWTGNQRTRNSRVRELSYDECRKLEAQLINP